LFLSVRFQEVILPLKTRSNVDLGCIIQASSYPHHSDFDREISKSRTATVGKQGQGEQR